MGVEKEIIEAGDGTNFPMTGDTITMHYTGTFTNGEKFIFSFDQGKPFQFKIGVGEVIKGWDLGVPQMSLGEKATLHITSDYAYGQQGAGYNGREKPLNKSDFGFGGVGALSGAELCNHLGYLHEMW